MWLSGKVFLISGLTFVASEVTSCATSHWARQTYYELESDSVRSPMRIGDLAAAVRTRALSDWACVLAVAALVVCVASLGAGRTATSAGANDGPASCRAGSR